MTTTLKKAFRNAILLTCLVSISVLFFSSCTEQPGGEGEWIPTPPDSSALGKIDHFIQKDEMAKFKEAFTVARDSITNNVKGYYIPASEAFNKEWLLKLLKDPKSVGIRLYYGVKSGTRNGNEFRLMIVGVDEQGNDLYLTKEGSKVATQIGGETEGGLEWGQCDPPCEPEPPGQ